MEALDPGWPPRCEGGRAQFPLHYGHGVKSGWGRGTPERRHQAERRADPLCFRRGRLCQLAGTSFLSGVDGRPAGAGGDGHRRPCPLLIRVEGHPTPTWAALTH